MKIQIIKIIPCLLAGFILSACVGAVNIGGGTSSENALINRCIIGNTAQSDPTCAKAVADTNGCITNPFLSGCEANPLFSPHVQNARDERVKFCNDANNEEDSLCTGSDSVKDICTHDPFSRVCGGFYYQERKLFCEDTLTFPRCADIVSSVCRTDPFNTKLCFEDDFYNSARERSCSNRASHPRCETTANRVCSDDPFNPYLCNTYIYNSNREAVCANEQTSERCKKTVSRVCERNAFDGLCNDISVYEPVRIDYCSITINRSESICIDILTKNPCILTPFGAGCLTDTYDIARNQHIDFCGKQNSKNDPTCAEVLSRPTSASFLQSFDPPLLYSGSTYSSSGRGNAFVRHAGLNSLTLNLDTGDGLFFSWRKICINSCTVYYYAGILSSTDLGLPLTAETASGSWNGSFRVRADARKGIPTNKDFVLNVNFGAGDQAGTISARIDVGNEYKPHYLLTGDFDSNGVIRGDIEYVRSEHISGRGDIVKTPGRLRGLIGQEGAVGVFINTNIQSSGQKGFSGGFIARPPSE